MRPVVGITSWRRRLETFYGPDTLQTLAVYYTDAVSATGMIPVMFPAALDPGDARLLVTMVDGLILSGGGDLDPATYGEENNHSTGFHPEVDLFEIAVVEEAKAQRKPVLAICRGLQLVNVALGGTLTQEVTSEGGVHDLITKDHVEMDARRHVVRFEESSILGDIYGAAEAKVNTLHHQGIAALADDLVVEGRSDDGLIEAARYGGDWWMLAVQWHPERLEDEHQTVFVALREAISNG